MSNNNGGTAFPTGVYTVEGMTLRDYFAAKAMQEMITGTYMWADHEDEDLARCAYELADAMIEERNKAKN